MSQLLIGIGAAVAVGLLVIISALRGKENRGPTSIGLDEEAIREVLVRLMQRGPESFVIIEEPRSTKFVQFDGSHDEPLVLDLPLVALSEEERQRAEDLFAEPARPEVQHLRWTGKPTKRDTYSSYQMDFGSDAAGAAKMAAAILQRVYGFGQWTELAITEE